MAMVMMAASAFHAGHSEVAEIETAYHLLTPLLGSAAASVFLVSLIASGVSSSVVGTMAGQMIMQGFTTWRPACLVPPAGDHDPGFRRGGAWCQCHQRPGDEPGGAQYRTASADGGFDPVRRSQGYHGRICKPGLLVRALAILGAAIVLLLNFVLLAQVFGIGMPGFATG